MVKLSSGASLDPQQLLLDWLAIEICWEKWGKLTRYAHEAAEPEQDWREEQELSGLRLHG